MQPIAWILIWGGISVFALIVFLALGIHLAGLMSGIRRDLDALSERIDPLVSGAQQAAERVEKARAALSSLADSARLQPKDD